jgi:hypothetical protein
LYGVVVAMSILTMLLPTALKGQFGDRVPTAPRARGSPRTDRVEGIGG